MTNDPFQDECLSLGLLLAALLAMDCTLGQRSPTFLAPGMDVMEERPFSHELG